MPVVRLAAGQLQPDQQRVVIGGAERVGPVEARRVELQVVVEDARLVGVDVPDRRPGHPLGQLLAGHGVVELARQPAEQVAVALVLGHEPLGQAGQAALLQGVDRVLLAVGVEVADHQRVRQVHRADEAEHGLGLPYALGVVAALAVALVRVAAGGLRVTALGLEVVDEQRERLAAAHPAEGLDQRRPPEDGVGRRPRRPDWGHLGRLVDRGDVDRVGARVGWVSAAYVPAPTSAFSAATSASTAV